LRKPGLVIVRAMMTAGTAIRTGDCRTAGDVAARFRAGGGRLIPGTAYLHGTSGDDNSGSRDPASESHRNPAAVAVGDAQQVGQRAAGARSPRGAIRASQNRATESHRNPKVVGIGDAPQVGRCAAGARSP